MPPYYTFLHYSRYGRGVVLNPYIDSPKYDTCDYTGVPYLDAIPVMNDDGMITVFAVNRSLKEELPMTVELRGFKDQYSVEEVIALSHPDPKATNTEDSPKNVTPHASSAVISDGLLSMTLEPLSWNVLRLKPC